MSSSLNHYTANVQVTDAVMHNKTPLSHLDLLGCRPGCQCDRCQGPDPGVLWPHGDVLQDHQRSAYPVSFCRSECPWGDPDCHGHQYHLGFPRCHSCCRFYFGAGCCCCCSCGCRRTGCDSDGSCYASSCYQHRNCRPRQPFRPSSMRQLRLLPPRPSLTQRQRRQQEVSASDTEGRWTRTEDPHSRSFRID